MSDDDTDQGGLRPLGVGVEGQRATVYEVVGVCDSRGWLHGRDHISDDAGRSTLCGLQRRTEGGRSDILCLQGGPANGYVAWSTAFQCRRCEAARRARGVLTSAI